MKKRIAFYTFGCRLNQSETAILQNGFKASHYEVVSIEEPSDVVVINTCTVTENGDADCRRLVNRVNRLNPQVQIALIGCQAQVQKEKLTDLHNVSWIIGNGKKFDLPQIIENLPRPTTAHVEAPSIPKESFTLPWSGVDTTHTRVNLKIQDGCDFFCSFCEIPYARGRARSRIFSDIINEAQALVANGHQEIILTGINIGTYFEEQKNLLNVITALEQIPNLKRIRISSIEPTTIPEELFERMGGNQKLCRYLHIPLQSGSDDVLTDMKRKYSSTEFRNFTDQVLLKVPDICLGTDVIVGFPGETPERFAQTLEILKELKFAYFHVFSYSERQYAKSKDLPGTVSKSEIQLRSEILRDLSQRKRHLFHQQNLGTVQQVLFEEEKNGYWQGWTDHYIRVRVQSTLSLYNQIHSVHLNRIIGPDMSGEIVKRDNHARLHL